MIGVEKKIFRLSSSVLNRTFKQEKSIFCSMVLRLMDTENYANNYCDSLSLVLELFPEIDRDKYKGTHRSNITGGFSAGDFGGLIYSIENFNESEYEF